jgi:D-alanyl-lipoteichoic acid acyltransferase DltB (MBOAT superfamily)
MLNFNRPYAAQSIRDFWRRWHISLSIWFRDCVYMPLGGGRVTGLRWVRNIAVVFLLSGLWHGAEWTFVCWGALHALYYFAGEAFARLRGPGEPGALRALVNRVTIVGLVCFAWIFFRATSLEHAMDLVTALPRGWFDPVLVAEQWEAFTLANPVSSLLPGLGALAGML